MKRRAAAALGALLAPWVLLFLCALATPLPPELREGADLAPSIGVVDRSGKLIREVRASDGCRSRFVSLDDLGERAARAMVAAEDRRFYWHTGIDPLAMVRAVGQAIAHRRIVSGASTLTQQLARTVVPRPKNLAGKLREMVLATRIEMSLSKRQILEQYLNRAPFGPGLRGIEAASQFYFGKPTRDLSLAEVALLAGMPRGPTLYDPRRGTARIERRRNRVLGRLLANGQVETDEIRRAESEPIFLVSSGSGYGAPHFVRALMAGSLDLALEKGKGASRVRTTLDVGLQRETEVLARSAMVRLANRHVSAASVVVLENGSGDLLAYLGSPDIGDAARLGENDGVMAKRQPGSALKPFVYELALEKLGFSAATVLPDVDLHLASDGTDYHPQNYDGRYHGPVRLREALANSYNVPAVYTASLLGPPTVLDRLRRVGFASLEEDAAHYGPGIALGDGEVRLLELANAYATLARGGLYLPVYAVVAVLRSGVPEDRPVRAGPVRVLDRRAASVITDVLSDPKARVASFGSESPLDLPFPVAVKTGTSKGFRDNWTIGFTSRVTVAVWVGNFDATPMNGVSGVTGAGPLFHDVMLAANRRFPSDAPLTAPGELEEAEVCPLSGALARSSCPHRHRESFVPGSAPRASCEMHVTARIDTRNGLRAGPRCDPRFVEERPYEAFDARYASWARAVGRPTAPTVDSPLCPSDRVAQAPSAPSQATRTRVTFPFDGATFVVDDTVTSRQSLPVRVVPAAPAALVRLFVDGRLVQSKRAPFAFDWPLARGTHLLRAEADVGEPSDPIIFTVQ
ncbi:MAG TPA: penicillin-binding protein 1C [Polyangiaceae bacterium]|nr:penicillin-binding protein 1C [Polyangiaceae bacterium]